MPDHIPPFKDRIGTDLFSNSLGNHGFASCRFRADRNRFEVGICTALSR